MEVNIMLLHPNISLEDLIALNEETIQDEIKTANRCTDLDDASEYMMHAEYYRIVNKYLNELRERRNEYDKAYERGYADGRADEYHALVGIDSYEKDALYTEGYQDGYTDCKVEQELTLPEGYVRLE